MTESSDYCFIKSASDKGAFSRFTVNFENATLSEEEAKNAQCNMFVDKQNSENQVVVVSLKDFVYTGKVDSSSLCKTLLLIRDKKKNKAKIISIRTSNLSKPVIKNETENPGTMNKLDVGEERKENMLLLTRNFGSKKQKRQSEIGSRFDKSVGENAAEINQTVIGLTVDPSDLKDFQNGNEDLISLLPPCNREATDISEVYKIEDFLTEAELESLNSTAKTLLEDPKDFPKESNQFLLSNLLKLNNGATLEKVNLLIYANCMLQFMKINVRELKKKNVVNSICPYSSSIGRKILNLFTVDSESGRARPLSMKDKVICYVLAINLLACGSVDMSIIVSSLKGVSQKKLKQLGRAVGIVPKNFSSPNNYVLNLPLPSLPSSSKRRRTM